MERDRIERERRDREEMERRDRERREKEREELDKRDREEKERQLQKVNQHFEESFRLVHQKVIFNIFNIFINKIINLRLNLPFREVKENLDNIFFISILLSYYVFVFCIKFFLFKISYSFLLWLVSYSRAIVFITCFFTSIFGINTSI